MRKETPEYISWRSMKERCNGNRKQYISYKDRGINVCEEWNNDFNRFLNDMGLKPSPTHTLDRIDNLKGYYKENCRWATKSEQAANRSSNLFYEYMGQRLILSEWAKKLSISYDLLRLRITREKLTFEDAIKEDPFGRKYKFKHNRIKK
jgi:hypothetical protein